METENIVAVEEEKPQDIEFISKKQARELFGVSIALFDRWQYPKSDSYRPDLRAFFYSFFIIPSKLSRSGRGIRPIVPSLFFSL